MATESPPGHQEEAVQGEGALWLMTGERNAKSGECGGWKGSHLSVSSQPEASCTHLQAMADF